MQNTNTSWATNISKQAEISIKKTIEQNKELITILVLKDLKLRPIRAKCLTSKLSNFLNLILKPQTRYVKNDVKHNIEFLKKWWRNSWKNIWWKGYLLVIYVILPMGYHEVTL